MDDLSKVFLDKVKEFSVELSGFLKDFATRYEDKVKSLEATAKHYSNSIINFKDEITKLEECKKKVKADTDKLIEDVKIECARIKSDFDRVMDGERKRIEKEDGDFKKRKKDFIDTTEKTTQLNQEALRAQDNAVKIEKEAKNKLKEIAGKITEYDVLISNYSQLLTFNENRQKELDMLGGKIKQNLADIDKRYADIVVKGNAQVAKDAELKAKGDKLREFSDSLDKRDADIKKAEDSLIKRQEEFEKQNALLTTWRSDLKAKEDNLRALDAELNKK